MTLAWSSKDALIVGPLVIETSRDSAVQLASKDAPSR